jgi:alpha-galactosidase
MQNSAELPDPEAAEGAPGAVTRRSFLKTAGSLAAAASATSSSASAQATAARPSSFLDIPRIPDAITTYTGFNKTVPAGSLTLARSGEHWSSSGILVETRLGSSLQQDTLTLTLSAPSTPIAALHVRWLVAVSPSLRALGDAWERSYGDLGWRNLIPERVMPWYFATHDGSICHGYGVRTDASALCFWQIDPEGVSLWLNVTSGGDAVALGQRQLTLATIVSHRGSDGEDAQQSTAELCRALCARPSRFAGAVYGANDWYYSYGSSTAESILRHTEFIVDLSPRSGVRPFSIIDEGYANGTPAWPDMAALAARIKHRTARPGIWIRPLEAPAATPRALLLPAARFGDQAGGAPALAYDPTVSEAREKISAKLRQLVLWNYEMVKHDFSTYDLLGQWGFGMGPQPTLPGWSFADRTRTNAEIIADFYALVREALGPHILIDGCNTIGHLAQGVFDMQRTGDDTSGHQWERTRRMGVNTLGFRIPQHGTFFTQDADAVGITDAIPWEFNRQWLDVLAQSGTATIISAGPPARGADQRAAIRTAFATAAAGNAHARPLDWLDTSTPGRWSPATATGQDQRYRWSGNSGASPFLSP